MKSTPSRGNEVASETERLQSVGASYEVTAYPLCIMGQRRKRMCELKPLGVGGAKRVFKERLVT